jgi:hypothetical protein
MVAPVLEPVGSDLITPGIQNEDQRLDCTLSPVRVFAYQPGRASWETGQAHGGSLLLQERGAHLRQEIFDLARGIAL